MQYRNSAHKRVCKNRRTYLIANLKLGFGFGQQARVILQFVGVEEGRKPINGDHGFDDIRSDLSKLRDQVNMRATMKGRRPPTIANGNCKSMKRDIAGKILSDVKGDEDVKAAVANELNATKTGVC